MELLRAIKARLGLDRGLGVDFVSRKAAVACETLEKAAATARRSPRQQAARRPASSSTAAAASSAASSSAFSLDAESRISDAARNASQARENAEARWNNNSDENSEMHWDNAPRENNAPVRPAAAPSLVPLMEPPPHPEKEALLAPLREEALQCDACELCAKRSSVVWGEGNLAADIMFIGEGPGRDEDLEGRPFVGRSGRLLTDIIEKGMNIPRPMIYITNVVKCRPPGNRDPKPEETAACFRYLKRQIEVIAPRIIVAVGGVAGCHLLNLPPKSPGLRGKWHDFAGIPLRVVYHPSYLLRQRGAHPGGKTKADKEMWEDVKEILQRLQTS